MAEKNEETENSQNELPSDRAIELLGLLKQFEQKTREVKTRILLLKKEVDEAESILQTVIDAYEDNRKKLLVEELKRQKLTWCTRCKTLMQEQAIWYIFMEGRGTFTNREENYIGGFEPFSALKRVCHSCWFSISSVGQWTNDPPKSERVKQAFFHTSRVEKHKNGFYAFQLSPVKGRLEIETTWPGKWRKIKESQCQMPELSKHDIDSFCSQLGLPPRISIDDEPGEKKEAWRTFASRFASIPQ